MFPRVPFEYKIFLIDVEYQKKPNANNKNNQTKY